jgi:hypothetical protein
MSTIEAFRSLNYTILFANGPMEAYLIYSHMPDMVKTVIFEPLWGDQCYERNNDTYLDSEDEETDATWQMREKSRFRAGYTVVEVVPLSLLDGTFGTPGTYLDSGSRRLGVQAWRP